jgi:hypothetical protein
MATSRVDDSGLLRGLLGQLWQNLPILLALDLLVVISALPVFLAARLWIPAAPLVAALAIGPAWATTIALTDQLTADRVRKLRDIPAAFWRQALAGVRVALPAAILLSVALSIGTLFVMAVAIALLAVVATLTAPAYCMAVTAGRRGWILWRTAAAIAGARPLFTIGSIALLVLIVTGLSSLGPTLAVGVAALLPAPLALYCSALTWYIVERTGDSQS